MAHDRSDLLRKVRALLDKAASTRALGNDAEADTFEQKADQLMTVYAIEQFELDLAKPTSEREKPEVRDIDYHISGTVLSEVQSALANSLWYLAKFCRCKIGWFGHTHSKVVGYSADLDYLELMLTNTMLQLVSKLSPKLDTGKSEYENFKAFKEAGFKWERIWDILHPGEPFNRSYCQRLLAQYREECRILNIPQVKGHPDIYARSYADAFQSRIANRLYDLENHRSATTSQALVLHNRDDELVEFFYEQFPSQRPPAPHELDCDCDTCHFKRGCRDPKCKRLICKDARKPIRASSYRSPAVDAIAVRAGRRAADAVDLSRKDSHLTRSTKELS